MSTIPAPLISVVIPTYNDAHFLNDALRSLCSQSFSEWEAIIINNYSSDETVEVVNSISDDRFRLENFANHGVIAASRNHGIKLARGQYVAFLDSDDTWYPDKLKRCIPYLERGNDLISHALQCIGDSQKVVYCGPSARASFASLLEKGNCITPSSTIVRKQVLLDANGFSENPIFNTSEDYHLWIRLAKAKCHMAFLEDILGEYRVHALSQSSSTLSHMSSAINVINELFPSAQERQFECRLRKGKCLSHPYYGAARMLYKRHQFSEAWPLFRKSFHYWPFNVRIYAAIGLNSISWAISSLSRICSDKNM